MINNKAFTLHESLIGLVICSIIMLLNVQLISLANLKNNISSNEIITSASYINKECAINKNIKIDNQVLTIYKLNDDVIKYYIQGNKLFRTLNNKGYVVVLVSNEKLEFKTVNQNMYVKAGDNEIKIC